MIRIILTISFLLATIVQVTAQRLVGMVFEVGESKTGCKIDGECDCCRYELYFLDDQQVAMVHHCDTGETIEKSLTAGTYKLMAGKLNLTFKQLVITHIQDNDEDDKSSTREDRVEVGPVEFTFGKCENGAQMLECKEVVAYRYGLRTVEGDDAKRIAELLETDEWDLMTR